jgi:hypothetical protein
VALGLGILSAGTHELVIDKREVAPIPPRLDVLVLSPFASPPPTDAEAMAALGPSGALQYFSPTTTLP